MARRFDGGGLLLASHNAGKVVEIRELLEPHGIAVRSAGELGLPEPEETGTTFVANAELKARAAAGNALGWPTLADNSGLAVDALDGAPGIYSARWAGPKRDFSLAMAEVERQLQARGAATPDRRRAQFIAVLSLCWPDGHCESFEGVVEGRLAWPPRGLKGFGYDPMFVPDGHAITFGEMEPAAKHAISHRARAFRKLIDACSADNPGFAVYVHWPFCRQKCPYCDFNSHVRETIDETRWARALVAEIDRTQVTLGDRMVTSVFFGGGTPSLMAPATVEAVLRAIENRWDVAEDVEITLEANPTSVEAGRFADLRAAGVNRVSLGVQALNDADLKTLGRGHSAREALAAVALAQQHFPRSSFDLIYAREGQSVDAWRAELGDALQRAHGHLSLYQLTIEPGTAFHQKQQRNQLALPDEDTQAALWDATQEMTEAAGLPGYEVSNHAAPGAESRHNLSYWRYGEYAGIGPGAHGRVVLDELRFATAAVRSPEAWLAAVESRGNGEEEPDALDPSIQAGEMLMMGLRTSEGVSRRAFRKVVGCELEHVIEPKRLRLLEAEGFVALDALALRVTARGRRVLNAVLRQLLP